MSHINTSVKDFWTSNGVAVYKKNNLVYISTPKCASTFYAGIVEHNEWEQINFNDINWNTNHIFGFIMNPIERYLKGLVQDVHDSVEQFDALKILLKHHINGNFTLLTHHSLPPSILYKEYIYNIDWIPLNNTVDNKLFFKKLCNNYNIDIQTPSTIWAHQSSPGQLKMFNEVKQMLGEFNETFYKIFSTDIDLYNSVVSNFNTSGINWEEISWLKK